MVTLTGQAERMRGVRMDGFEIHANAIQTILDGSFVHRSKDQWGLVPALLAALGLTGSLLLIWSGTRPALLAVIRVGLYLGIGAVAAALFWWSRYWLDIVPLYAMLVAQHLGGSSYQRYLEGHKRRQVQSMFGRYVSARVVEQLVQNPDLANPSGRKERLTMFFSDVRGFTSMSEKMEPQDVQHLLSEYFTEMTHILFKHEGTLDKFMGDAIMAFFGNPEPQPDHARRAVLMALEMQEAVARLNQKWTAAGRRTIGVGMGQGKEPPYPYLSGAPSTDRRRWGSGPLLGGRLRALKGDDKAFFKTHPNFSARIKAVQNLIEAQGLKATGVLVSERFVRLGRRL
ncbi:MAG: hypothetical protein E6K61_05545 [Nitrospirae bacterium]|nr:MAG: hypothetical protein E6K61_05545 [Nitrospirota bacterium]